MADVPGAQAYFAVLSNLSKNWSSFCLQTSFVCNLPSIGKVVKDYPISAKYLAINFWGSQTKHIVADDLPLPQRFFEAVLPRRKDVGMDPTTHYKLWRKTVIIMKV